MVNWKMMDTLVNHVDEVDMLLESNGGGKYIVGKCQALIHTLTWTNCVRKELVSRSDFLCYALPLIFCLTNVHIVHVF